MHWYKEPGKVYIKDNNDIVIAKITYVKADDETMSIDHTIVDPAMQGQGLASKLVREAVREIRAAGYKVSATCPYAERWLSEHQDELLDSDLSKNEKDSIVSREEKDSIASKEEKDSIASKDETNAVASKDEAVSAGPGSGSILPSTEKLYEADAYIQEFDAQVIKCEQHKKEWRIALDRTAFYPEGGGQPGDQGVLRVTADKDQYVRAEDSQHADAQSADPVNTEAKGEQALAAEAQIKEVQITDTHEKDGLIWHYAQEPLQPGTKVHGRIDWKRRFDMMQNHSGEHIVSGLIHTHYGYDNVGFHMGSDFITIDLNGDLTMDQLAQIEQEANEIVWQDAAVQIHVYTEEEAKAVEYRSKKELHGMVRIVTFPGADTCACCGTHVSTTGQIGLIRLFSCQKFHEGVRIELLCGRRALEYLNSIWKQNREVSMALSARPLETASAVERMKESEAQARYRLVELEQKKIRSFAEDLRGEGNLLVLTQGLKPDWVAKLTVDLMERRKGICAVFSGDDENGYKYAVGMENADLKAFVKEMNSALNGRGGGRPHFAQGSADCSEEQIKAFFTEQESSFAPARYE